MTGATTVPLARARRAVVAGMLAIVVAGWSTLQALSLQMGEMGSALTMPMTASWTLGQAAFMVGMWAVMMAAMMLPSALPMVIAHDRMDRASAPALRGSSRLFVLGYVVVWSSFAAGATALQWALQWAGLVDAMGAVTQDTLAAGLLVAAGLFQFTPIKQRSLGQCRTPMGFLATSWRDGRSGSVRMGLHHGVVCLRCCSVLMLLLFVLGVMHLLWVAALATLVLAEKVLRHGEVVAKVGGAALVVWGLALLA